MNFNPSPPTIMHIDLNSCFATVEQQANPRLRDKPIAVAAYTTGNGCILAASVEAKRLGVKTGMRVREGKILCPWLVILPPDPWKYRFVNRKLLALLREYTSDVTVKSIDEMVLDLKNSPKIYSYIAALSHGYIFSNATIQQCNNHLNNKTIVTVMTCIAHEIKERIKSEIGEWLTVSIGIAPNDFLAKTASGLHKPDGLDVIDGTSIEQILSHMELEDFCGIKKGNGIRLRRYGIFTPIDFYRASVAELRTAFHSVVGHYWWFNLHGWSAPLSLQNQVQKTFGHSYALYKPYAPNDSRLHQILSQLVGKMGRRLRAGGFTAGGIHISTLFSDYTYWHHGEKQHVSLYTDSDLYKKAFPILKRAPCTPVRILSVSCFALTEFSCRQESLFPEDKRQISLTNALDRISDRFGDFAVIPGRMFGIENKIMDRISFGGVNGLEEFVYQEGITSEDNFAS